MQKLQKVRFYANVRANEGAEPSAAQLISVIEKRSGDLIVSVKANRFMEWLDLPDNLPLREHRYTVHVSPKSDGHTLTNTFAVEGGPDIVRNVSFVTCDGKPLIAVLFSYRWPTLSHEHFRMEASSKYVLIGIADFSDYRNTLITHVIVASKGQGARLAALVGGQMHSFAHFDILVVPTFIKIYPIEQGDALFVQTSDLQVGNDRGRGQFGRIDTFTPEALQHGLIELSQALRQRFIARLVEMLSTRDPEALAIVLSQPDGLLTFANSPFPDGDRPNMGEGAGAPPPTA